MKKKIGDLTIRELKDLQNGICWTMVGCSDCPYKHCCLDTKIDLDQEIEVKADE